MCPLIEAVKIKLPIDTLSAPFLSKAREEATSLLLAEDETSSTCTVINAVQIYVNDLVPFFHLCVELFFPHYTLAFSAKKA